MTSNPRPWSRPSTRGAPRRAKFLEAYLHDLIDRDVRQLADIQRRAHLLGLARALAGRAAQPIKIEAVASDAGLPATTGRSVRMSKLLFIDTGVLCHLLGRTAERLARPEAALGPVLENFVLGRFHLGVVLHTGTQTLSFGDRLVAAPIDVLWAP